MKINDNEKVFSHFIKIYDMKKMKVGTITIVIAIAVITIGVLSNPNEDIIEKSIEIEDVNEEEIIVDESVSIKIQEKIDKIKKNNLENQYNPKPREWITSGPFQIDRSEYLLGEKIFTRINELQPDEKGQIAFMRPLNNTHYSVYITIPFDGVKNDGFNYYLQPMLSKSKGICSVDDILGEWIVVFRGTQYSNLNFEIIEQVLPGDEEDYKEDIC